MTHLLPNKTERMPCLLRTEFTTDSPCRGAQALGRVNSLKTVVQEGQILLAEIPLREKLTVVWK